MLKEFEKHGAEKRSLLNEEVRIASCGAHNRYFSPNIIRTTKYEKMGRWGCSIHNREFLLDLGRGTWKREFIWKIQA